MRLLLFILYTLTAVTAFADEKKYGSFILNTDIPDTLFFIDEIKANDSFELRKALRNHDIQNIVLASPGGSVWEGLQMAGIIFDKKLRTYIPRGGTCASACSYLFFAGNERLADGELGVHQAYSSDAKKQQAVGQTQYTTQFTVSEIIGFLNEFGTPAFVYERMFQDIDMYFFDPLELTQLNSDAFTLESNKKVLITKQIITGLKERREKQPELSRQELVALIQTRLQEIGCNPGPADGIWGRKTQAAAIKFAKKAALPVDQGSLISINFVEKLAAAPNGFCPKEKYNEPNAVGYTIAGDYHGDVRCGAEITDKLRVTLTPNKSVKNSKNIEYYNIRHTSQQVGKVSGNARFDKSSSALSWSLSDDTQSAKGNAEIRKENGRYLISGFANSGCTYELIATQF